MSNFSDAVLIRSRQGHTDRDDCDEKDDRKSTEGDVGLVIIDMLRSL